MSFFGEARSILTALRTQKREGVKDVHIQDQLIDGLGRAREFSQLEGSSAEWQTRQRHRASIFEKLLKRHL